jgi:uncharacterized protein
MAGGPSPLEFWKRLIHYSLHPVLPGNLPRCFGKWMAGGVTLLVLTTVIGCSFLDHRLFLTRKEPSVAASNLTLPFEEIWFRSTDGVMLNGWLVDGYPGSPRLLFFHGNASNLNDNLEYLKLLHDHGFAIFIFDYRGYGKSQGEPLYENDLYRDARGAIAYLEGRGWQHGKTIYFGQSLGAAVALQMALEEPPAGLVMESSFTNMNDMFRHLAPIAYYLASWSMNLRFDNLAKIGKVKVPLLLIHGDDDQVAPVSMARRLFARANEPKILQTMVGGGHCDASTLDIAKYFASWDRFLSVRSGVAWR